MNKRWYILLLLLIPIVFYCCQNGPSQIEVPIVAHPEDNPLDEAKVELGRKLFFDPRLSRDNTVSCASCHIPEKAFTDGKKTAIGIDGRSNPRNSPSLLNAGFLKTVMFDAHLPTLEMQVIVPIQEHSEMDISMVDLIAKLSKDEYYSKAAKEIFNRNFDPWVLTRSISAFERTLVSMDSRFDKFYFNKDNSVLTKDELAGWTLFSGKLNCIACHAPPYFTTFKAECNGLYEDYGEDQGRFRIHSDSADMGKFKVPSLRNIELTGPYMHDGSFDNLSDIIHHYARGGADHVNKSELIRPFSITVEEETQVISFLKTLTDTTYLKDFR